MTKGPVAEGLGPRGGALRGRSTTTPRSTSSTASSREHRERARGPHGAWTGRSRTSARSGLAGARDAYARALELDPHRAVGEGRVSPTSYGGWVTSRRPTGSRVEVIDEGTPALPTRRSTSRAGRLVPAAARPLRRTPSRPSVEPSELDGRWIAVRFDLALALMCAGDRGRAFLEYQRGVHQAVNGGVERLRGVVRMGLDDLEECLAERPALAATREAIAARDLLRSTLPA